MRLLKGIYNGFVKFVLLSFLIPCLLLAILLFPILYGVSRLWEDKTLLFRTLIHKFVKALIGLIRFLLLKGNIYVRNRAAIENIKASVIICNHQSFLDPLLILSRNKHTIAIVKYKYFRVPILGMILRHAGYVPPISERELLPARHAKKFENLDSLFNHDMNLLIFPEGTRSRNGKVQDFKPGAFKVAKRYKRPIVLLYMANSQKIWRRDRFRMNCFSKKDAILDYISMIGRDELLNVKAVKERVRGIYLEKEKHGIKNGD